MDFVVTFLIAGLIVGELIAILLQEMRISALEKCISRLMQELCDNDWK